MVRFLFSLNENDYIRHIYELKKVHLILSLCVGTRKDFSKIIAKTVCNM